MTTHVTSIQSLSETRLSSAVTSWGSPSPGVPSVHPLPGGEDGNSARHSKPGDAAKPACRLSQSSTGTANPQHVGGDRGVLSPTDPRWTNTLASHTEGSRAPSQCRLPHLSRHRREHDFPSLSSGISSLLCRKRRRRGTAQSTADARFSLLKESCLKIQKLGGGGGT